MRFVFRAPQEADLAGVEKLLMQIQQLHVDMRPDIYQPMSQMLTQELWRETVERNCALVACVCESGESKQSEQIVGYAEWMIREYQSPTHVRRKVLFVDTMVVDKDWHRKGIGGQLFDRIRQLAAELGVDGIELQVNARNQNAKQMYEHYGFTEKSINMELPL